MSRLFVSVLLLILVSTASVSARKCFTLFHTTDVHGWIDGHPHIKDEDMTMGDLESFFIHAEKKIVEKDGCEMLVFDSGDLIEGTGISDVTDIHGENIYPVFDMIPQYQAITLGNHDVENELVVDYFWNNMYPLNPNRYICSNCKTTDGKMMTQPYKILTMPRSGARILVLGMLYSFTNHASNIKIEDVKVSLSEPWFQKAMSEANNVDLVVALCHIGPSDPALRLVYATIRQQQPTKPLVILAGHDHGVLYEQWDDNSVMMESTCYNHYIGTISFDVSSAGMTLNELFMLHTSIDLASSYLGIDKRNFSTPAGTKIDKWIKTKSNELGLYDVLGCSNITYDEKSDFTNPNSLFTFMFKNVYPKVVYNKARKNTQISAANTLRLRAHLYSGKVTKNDVFAMAPFKNPLWVIPNVMGTDVAALQNSYAADNLKKLPKYAWSTTSINKTALYDIIIPSYDAGRFIDKLNTLFPNKYHKELYNCSDMSVCDDTAMWLAYVPKYMKC